MGSFKCLPSSIVNSNMLLHRQHHSCVLLLPSSLLILCGFMSFSQHLFLITNFVIKCCFLKFMHNYCINNNGALPQDHSELAPTNAPAGCSIHGMGCIFSSNSWPCINPHCTTIYFFWLTFDFYLFLVIFLGPFSPPTLTYIRPFHLSTLFT